MLEAHRELRKECANPEQAISTKAPPHRRRFRSTMERSPRSPCQSWETRLLCRDATARRARVLWPSTLTAAVLKEAVRFRADVLLAYHPPIFKPIPRPRTTGDGMDALVFDCIRTDRIYSRTPRLTRPRAGPTIHSRRFAARPGQNLEHVDKPGGERCKLVTFVPRSTPTKLPGSMFRRRRRVIGGLRFAVLSRLWTRALSRTRID